MLINQLRHATKLAKTAQFACTHVVAYSKYSEDLEDVDEARDKRFVDRLIITARSGAGGNGCVSFWRSASKGKHTPADGGNGGDGGNIVLQASSQMKSLAGIQQLYKASSGGHGSKQKQHGRSGSDTIILVPLGTTVSRIQLPDEEDSEHDHLAATEGQKVRVSDNSSQHSTSSLVVKDDMPEWLKSWRRPWVGARDYDGSDDDTDEGDTSENRQQNNESESININPTNSLSTANGNDSENSTTTTTTTTNSQYNNSRPSRKLKFLADLVKDGERAVVAHGGKGGRGNAAMKAKPGRPAPAIAENGTPGESVRLQLELKLIADVALVGFPNAGKSTLLRALSSATPRIGSFPFTTLTPQLGVLTVGKDWSQRRLVIADVPGLLEGAHVNKGLGHAFLRHIERTRALVYVLDASPEASRKPWEQYSTLRHELQQYSPALLKLPALVLVNKTDVVKRPSVTASMVRKKLLSIANAADIKGATVNETSVSSDHPSDEAAGHNAASVVIGTSGLTGLGLDEFLQHLEDIVPR